MTFYLNPCTYVPSTYLPVVMFDTDIFVDLIKIYASKIVEILIPHYGWNLPVSFNPIYSSVPPKSVVVTLIGWRLALLRISPPFLYLFRRLSCIVATIPPSPNLNLTDRTWPPGLFL